MILRELIQQTGSYLEGKGVESSRLNAENLIAHLLGRTRLQLYLDLDQDVPEEKLAILRDRVRRRAARVPLQHIVGTVSFCGIELDVSPAALIPRPETEILAELAWKFAPPGSTPAILDFCTGTACIAIAIARHHPGALISAIDLSPAALQLARQNAAKAGVTDRIQFIESDLFSALPPDATFDLIVSNPPYIPTADIAGLAPEVRDHDPTLAIDGGADGLGFYKYLAQEAATRLRANGRLMLEFGDRQETELTILFKNQNWVVEAVLQDYTPRPRFMVVRKA